jgi:TolB-like protein
VRIWPIFFIAVVSPAFIYSRSMTILVHPLQNAGDARYSWLHAGLTATVISDLGKIKDISVISEADRKKVLKEIEFSMSGLVDEEKIVRVGKVLGANVIFTGSYQVMGNQVRVNAQLVDVEKARIEKSVKIDGSLEKLFDLQDRIVLSLLAETEKIRISDITPVKITKQDREKIQTEIRPSLSSYELYARGLEVQKSDPQKAMEFFRQSVKADPNYLDALREAGLTAGKVLNLFDESLSYLARTEKLLSKKAGKLSPAYASLMNSIGIVYDEKGDLEKTIAYYTKSQKTYEKLNQKETAGYAVLMNNLGIANRKKGDLKKAVGFYISSKKIRDKLGLQKTAGYAELMNNAGVAFQESGDLEGAMKGFKRAKETYEAMGLQKTGGYAGLLNNIALVHKENGAFPEALQFHLQSKQFFGELSLEKTTAYANVLYNIAIVYEKLGQRPEARAYFGDAYSAYAGLGRAKDAEDARKNAERLRSAAP